jgi:para-nitrobenzyl esterase
METGDSATILALTAGAMLAAAKFTRQSVVGLVGAPTPLRKVTAVTDCGAVEGTVWPVGGREVMRFLAVPYGATTAGAARWKTPQPVAPWEGTRATPHALPVCPQNGRMAMSTFSGHSIEQTEDCLALNVWTAALDEAARLPVIFYIHGGAGKHGSAMTPELSGHGLAARGAVYVNINYRLGTLGFLAHPELSAEDPHGSSGNYATLDQLAALEWVQTNIARFGGDPGNVTIWGLSSGAQYVNQLMCCPLAKGLFHRAMVQSSTDVANGARAAAAAATRPARAPNRTHHSHSLNPRPIRPPQWPFPIAAVTAEPAFTPHWTDGPAGES